MPLSFQEVYGNPDEYFAGQSSEGKIKNSREFINQHLISKFSKEMRILDIGTGTGEFVKVCRDLGYLESYGLEPSLAIAKKAKVLNGLDLITESADVYAKNMAGTYDLIFMNSVLEHVEDPNLLMASVNRLLKKGGKVFIELPRDPNLLTILANFWEKPRGRKTVYNLSPTWGAFHVYGFTPRSLRILMEKQGFTIDELKVFSLAGIPSGKGWKGKIASGGANILQVLSNTLGLASNMTVWATKG